MGERSCVDVVSAGRLGCWGSVQPRETWPVARFTSKPGDGAGKHATGRRSKLLRIMRERATYDALLTQLRVGASLSSVAAAVRVTPDTLGRWLERGKLTTHGHYRRFYLDAMEAIGLASVATEAEVRRSNPEFWLRYGPRRYLGDEWRDDPEKHAVIEHASPGSNTAQHNLIEALKELRASGIDLNALVDGNAGVIESNTSKSTTSHYETDNDSLPDRLLEGQQPPLVS